MRKYWTAALLLVFALASSGCMMNSYSSDPNKRMLALISESEDLKQIELEMERFWMIDQPPDMTPERVHGGSAPERPTIPRPTDDPPVPAGPVVMVTVTVANVRKEQGLLFTVGKEGLTYIQKLPAGEAIDLVAAPGTRYAAVFQSEPYQEAHVVKGKATWLLRPTEKPTTCCDAGRGIRIKVPTLAAPPALKRDDREQIFSFYLGFAR